jgi:hypothetical protein
MMFLQNFLSVLFMAWKQNLKTGTFFLSNSAFFFLPNQQLAFPRFPYPYMPPAFPCIHNNVKTSRGSVLASIFSPFCTQRFQLAARVHAIGAAEICAGRSILAATAAAKAKAAEP